MLGGVLALHPFPLSPPLDPSGSTYCPASLPSHALGTALSLEFAAAKPTPGAMSFISMGDVDLLHPPRELEQRRHKLKRLVQSPNSFFMDVKCPGCFNITTVFSHAQTVVLCGSCSTVLCQPTGGKARLTEGCSFRKKVE